MTERPHRLEIWRFSLPFRSGNRSHLSGALLRAWWTDDGFGLSELMPWPHLGDPRLDDLIDSIRSGDWTSTLVKRGLELSFTDFSVRSEGKELLPSSVENHFLIADESGPLVPARILEIRRRGFRSFKIKMANSEQMVSRLADAASWISDLRIRLDFNGSETEDRLLSALDRLPVLVRDRIELIEDPSPFSPEGWGRFREKSGILVFLDREGETRSSEEKAALWRGGMIDGVIHKPGWTASAEARELTAQGVPLIVTSLLGHPVGQLHAARIAASVAPLGTHGCFSHTAFEGREVDGSYLRTAGPRLLPQSWPLEALEKKKWERVL